MFDAIKRMFNRHSFEDTLSVDGVDGEWYIVRPDGERYAGPYGRAADAKGQLTRLRRTYTPASRRGA